MENEIFYDYLLFFSVSFLIGSLLAYFLLKKEEYSSPLKWPIKILVGLGIGFALSGISILYIHSDNNVYSGKWETIEKSITNDNLKEVQKLKENKNFNETTLKFNDETIQTASIVFTIAGICLGTLGILWLGHLESTRLPKDRIHDQRVQIDRLLSLLSLGIDLFIRIDKDDLDFIISENELLNNKYIEYEENFICWNKEKYYLPREEYDIKYRKHRISICKYLYSTKTSNEYTTLNEIHRIIEELKKVYYEKDISLYDVNNEQSKGNKEKRIKFIEILKKYSDYKNFLDGNTREEDFNDKDYKPNDKSINELINNFNENFLLYLNEKYEESKKDKIIFKDYFIEKISIEFVREYLINDKHIYSAFKVNDMHEIFLNISEANLKADKLFNSYFNIEFLSYLKEKEEYLSINLSNKDFTFEEYLEIFENTFLQVNSDIKSVEKLYYLFESFVELYNCLEKDLKNEH